MAPPLILISGDVALQQFQYYISYIRKTEILKACKLFQYKIQESVYTFV